MAQIVPLIRAAALAPILRWMEANGLSASTRLEAVDLGYLPLLDPDRAVPLLNVLEFIRQLGREAGPDITCRVVNATSVVQLARLGQIALGAETPRAALRRVEAAMPHHCTHEHIVATAMPDGLMVRDTWSIPLDDEVLHLVQQYVAAMIRALCGLAVMRDPAFARIEMVPHPDAGLEHLRPWFGTTLVAAESRALGILITSPVPDRRFRAVGRARVQGSVVADWPVLRQDGGLTRSASEVLAGMLANGVPTVERLAAAAGMSVRTLQRRLADEGSSFSQLLNTVRRDAAVTGLSGRGGSLADLADALGYAHQSGLTRSVRRWTGQPPSRLRQNLS